MAESGERARGRPIDPTIRDRVVEAAWTLFLHDGVEATSIDAIARQAHVSKVTLYRHFTDKVALFEAGMEAENARLGGLREAAFSYPSDFEDQLVGFGEATMHYLTAGDAVDFYSVLVGELRRHPGLARTFYEVGPGHTHRALTELIQRGSNEQRVSVADASLAAEELFGMWQGFSNFQLSLGMDPEVVRIEASRRVRSAVTVFLLAHPFNANLPS